MRLAITFLLFCLFISIQGQNLVLNPSFENFKKCPKELTVEKLRLKDKLQSVKGTPDFFNTCSDQLHPLKNDFGYQVPFHGEGHCGLILTSDRRNECATREYIELKLNKSLSPGKKYLFSVQINLADKSGYYTDQIGAIFNQKSLSKAKNINSLLRNPSVSNPLNNFVVDTSGWTEISAVYNAKGGEEYIVIGNFQACNQTSRIAVTPNDSAGVLKNVKRALAEDLKKAPSLYTKRQHKENKKKISSIDLFDYAYYFIDQVSLTPYTLNDSIEFLTQEEACFSTPDKHATEPSTNLLEDGSFNLNKEGKNPYWKNASKGTPDFLDDNIGLYLYSDLGKNNREYIISPLKEKLFPCNTYSISFRVKRKSSYRFAVDRIEAAFIDTVYRQNNRLIFPLQPAFQSPKFQIIENSTEWITICGEFTPTSCAQYMVIGNFTPDRDTYILPLKESDQGGPFAYYFVDDFVVRQTGTITNCSYSCTQTGKEMTVHTPVEKEFISDTLQFFFNIAKANPTKVDYIQLRTLLDKLLQDTSLTLVIEGHADNTGSKLANNQLSKQRATTLMNLFLQLGLDQHRIKLKSYGSSRPMASNNSVGGRRLNRRVQLYLLKSLKQP